MRKDLCDASTRRDFRVVANIIVVGIIVMIAGVVISILSIINYYLGTPLFPFSGGTDPPYLGISCGVMLTLLIVMSFAWHKIKKRACESLELPFT